MVLCPILILLVQAIVFGRFLNIQVDHYYLFLISGLVPWIFIVQTIEMSTSIFVTSGQLLKSFPISPLIYLSAQIFDNLINFIAAYMVMFTPFWLYFGGFRERYLLLPLPILGLTIGVFGLAWLLATMQVFYRDTRFLISFGLQIAYYLTPVFYPIQFVPEGWRWLVVLNPFYYLIAPFQLLLGEAGPREVSLALLRAYGVSFLLLGFAALVWRQQKRMIYYHV